MLILELRISPTKAFGASKNAKLRFGPAIRQFGLPIKDCHCWY